MKRFFILLTIALIVPVVLHSYQVREKSKSSFGGAQPSEQDQNKPAEQATPGVRSFTSYSSRQKRDKGAQAQPQADATDPQALSFAQVEKLVQSGKIAAVAVESKEKNTNSTSPSSAPSTPTAGNTATAGGAGMAQAAAAMQQLQGMQSMMKNMGGMMGGTAGGSPTGSTAAGATQGGKTSQAAPEGQQGNAEAAQMDNVMQQFQGMQDMMKSMGNLMNGGNTNTGGKSK